jgi:hypothetical protein
MTGWPVDKKVFTKSGKAAEIPSVRKMGLTTFEWLRAEQIL